MGAAAAAEHSAHCVWLLLQTCTHAAISAYPPNLLESRKGLSLVKHLCISPLNHKHCLHHFGLKEA